MLSGLESGLGLDIVVWLQTNGNGVFDAVSGLLHQMGGVIFYLAVLALVFWALDRTLGLRLMVAVIGASALTEILKALFQTPRPHLAYPDQVVPLVTQEGFGMPSGHVLIAVAGFGYLAYLLKNRVVTWLVALYIVLMGWARMYAGVHYPQDVIGGLLFGGLLLWAIISFSDRVGVWWQRSSLAVQLGVTAVLTVLVILLTGANEQGLTMGGILFGGLLGLIWEQRAVRFADGGDTVRRVLRFVGGLILVIGAYAGLKVVFDGLEPHQVWRLVRYAIVGVALTGLWPWLCVQFGLTISQPAGVQTVLAEPK